MDDEIQVPNLPAIARYLAQHPETVDALELAVIALNSGGNTVAAGVIDMLLAALRGDVQ